MTFYTKYVIIIWKFGHSVQTIFTPTHPEYMKTLIKIVSLVALLALPSCTVTFLPPVGGGQCGYGGRPSGYVQNSCGQPGQPGRPGFVYQNGGGQPTGPGGYPMAYPSGSRLSGDVSPDPSSRYYAGRYIRDSGGYNPQNPNINYSSGGKTIHVGRY